MPPPDKGSADHCDLINVVMLWAATVSSPNRILNDCKARNQRKCTIIKNYDLNFLQIHICSLQSLGQNEPKSTILSVNKNT